LKTIVCILFLLTLTISALAQNDSTIVYNYDGYTIKGIYDTTNYCSNLSISKNGKNILYDTITAGTVQSIKDIKLESNGEKVLLIEYYTGGAHCCTLLTAGIIKNDKYTVKDTLFWGDSGYEIKDIDGDGVMELSGFDVRFAYAFTSFAGSQFPILIYQYKNGKFIDVTKKFPKLIEKDLADYKKQLNDDYLTKGYNCPQPGQDIYSAESGPVQALLAAITEDYYNLGKVDDAYDYINKVYKCDDKKAFIQTLKKDYKLK